MKLPKIAIFVTPVIIIQTICAVGILLYLTDEYSGTYCMDSSCLDKYYITFLDLNFIKNLSDCIIGNSVTYLFLGCLSLKSAIQACSGLAVKYIPYFIFTILTLNLKCIFIIRVNLYGQRLLCIYKLYKNRESVKRLALPSECLLAYSSQLVIEEHSSVSSFSYSALSVRMCR